MHFFKNNGKLFLKSNYPLLGTNRHLVLGLPWLILTTLHSRGSSRNGERGSASGNELVHSSLDFPPHRVENQLVYHWASIGTCAFYMPGPIFMV